MFNNLVEKKILLTSSIPEYSILGKTTSSVIKTLKLNSPRVSLALPLVSVTTGLTHHQSSIVSNRGKSGILTIAEPNNVGGLIGFLFTSNIDTVSGLRKGGRHLIKEEK